MMDSNARQAKNSSESGHAGGGYLAHHFQSRQQQFDAGKLGMWLFLVTEVLFFSGLFVGYTVYRRHHPEVFSYASQFLETSLGAVNTGVLILSSLTMAWGVRCAQLGQRRGLISCLTITLMCASFFLGIKAVEYSHKWDVGLLWAGRFVAAEERAGDSSHASSLALFVFCLPAIITLVGCGTVTAVSAVLRLSTTLVVNAALTATCLSFFVGVATGKGIPQLQHAVMGEPASHPPGPEAAPSKDGPQGSPTETAETSDSPRLAGVFFSIYFAMTGVHAIHVIAGMVVITWLLWRAALGSFGPSYFGPVDYGGLYWHLVDLVWIYLFPLLYLIQ